MKTKDKIKYINTELNIARRGYDELNERLKTETDSDYRKYLVESIKMYSIKIETLLFVLNVLNS